jgi:hypothetical protein
MGLGPTPPPEAERVRGTDASTVDERQAPLTPAHGHPVGEGQGDIMLSDAEQRKLNQIELNLQTEDPLFARSFSDQSRWRLRWCGITGRGWLIMGALIMCLAVLMINAWVAALAAIIAGIGVGLWLTDCWRLRVRRRSPCP